jgi:hypothetical protein
MKNRDRHRNHVHFVLVVLRVDSASERVRLYVLNLRTGKPATLADAHWRGFYIQGKDAPDILSLVLAQRDKDNERLERNSG